MLRITDGIVVTLACLLLVESVFNERRERAERRTGAAGRQRSGTAWNLFLGLAMLCSRGPHLFGLSRTIISVSDPLSALLSLTAAVLAFRDLLRLRATRKQSQS